MSPSATRVGIACLFVTMLVSCAVPVCGQHVRQLSPANLAVRDISGFSKPNDYSVDLMIGDSGYVYWSAAETSVLLQLDPTVTFFTGCILDTEHAVICGSRGAVYWTAHHGVSWKRTALGSTVTLNGIAYNGSGILLAVADSGLTFRSLDSGRSWSRAAIQGAGALSAVSFAGASLAVAVGDDSSLFKTTDAGLSWVKVPVPMALLAPLYQLVQKLHWTSVASSGTDTILIALERPAFMLLSYDAMRTFDTAWLDASNPKSGPMRKAVYAGTKFYTAFAIGEGDVIYVAMGQGFHHWRGTSVNVYGDADGNIDRTPARFLSGAYTGPQYSTINPVGGEFVVGDVSGAVHVLRPDSLGNESKNFVISDFFKNQGILTDPADFLSVSVLPSGIGCSVDASLGYLHTTSDGGRTWSAGRGRRQRTNTACMLDDTTIFAIGWNGLILRFRDTLQGRPLIMDSIPSGTNEKLHGIVFPRRDVGIIVGDYGYIMRSSDSGQSWTSIPTATQQFLYSVAFADSMIGVAVGDAGTILRSTDAGLHWFDVNNILSGTGNSIRDVQAFSDGTFLARAQTQLIRSTDFGKSWHFVNIPIGDSTGMGFYNSKVGIVAARSASSAIVPDTAFLSYTKDGGGSWKQFSVPIWNYNRVLFHWLNDHEVLLYGIAGFIVDVDISGSDVKVTRVATAGAHATLAVYPNPSSGELRVKYTTETSGPVTIELWDEAGKRIHTLWSGNDVQGDHSRALSIPEGLHGPFLLRLSKDGTETSTAVAIR